MQRWEAGLRVTVPGVSLMSMWAQLQKATCPITLFYRPGTRSRMGEVRSLTGAAQEQIWDPREPRRGEEGLPLGVGLERWGLVAGVRGHG